jgi:hypothetical protein
MVNSRFTWNKSIPQYGVTDKRLISTGIYASKRHTAVYIIARHKVIHVLCMEHDLNFEKIGVVSEGLTTS